MIERSLDPNLADALAKRGRSWGDRNAAEIQAMRDETPARYPIHLLGDGHFVRARRYDDDPIGIAVGTDSNGRTYRVHL